MKYLFTYRPLRCALLLKFKDSPYFSYVFRFKSEMTRPCKYLNVAEKNDAAKNIALHLSRGTSQRVSNCLQIIIAS